ncbi:hypothetical protein ACNF49_12780 [Actinomadura sp. ATCC 39365]|uniref:hypothetical protein n=1 Tax=Nonomuraea sp. NPDC005692 TaxID=3157168 RepID=UPI0033FD6B88
MSKLTRAAATSVAAVALAATCTAMTAPAASATTSAASAAASTWIKYGDYSSEAKCIAKGKELKANGTYLSYFCQYTGFFTLMVLTR